MVTINAAGIAKKAGPKTMSTQLMANGPNRLQMP